VEKENQSYPIDIRGEWRAGRYRFWQRHRSGWPETRGEEFDQPFVRLDRMGEDNFDIHWMRHTGKWWRVHKGKTFEEAMALLRERGVWSPYP
jgi:hypothetical protein